MSHTVTSGKNTFEPRVDTTVVKEKSNALSQAGSLSKHCLGTVTVSSPELLIDIKSFNSALYKILETENVRCLGRVDHEFPNKSFTVVVALAESHISVHTWPEYHKAQLDVFLCNYIHDNRDKSKRIFAALLNYFNPDGSDIKFVDRP